MAAASGHFTIKSSISFRAFSRSRLRIDPGASCIPCWPCRTIPGHFSAAGSPETAPAFPPGPFPWCSALARLRSSIVGRPSTFFPAPFLCNQGSSFSHMPFRVFPIDFSTIYLNYITKFLLYLTEPANSPRSKDNFMAKITLVNDKLGYTSTRHHIKKK